MKKLMFTQIQMNNIVTALFLATGGIKSNIIGEDGERILTLDVGPILDWGPITVRIETSDIDIKYVISTSGGTFSTVFQRTHKGGFFLESTDSHLGLTLLKKLVSAIADNVKYSHDL